MKKLIVTFGISTPTPYQLPKKDKVANYQAIKQHSRIIQFCSHYELGKYWLCYRVAWQTGSGVNHSDFRLTPIVSSKDIDGGYYLVSLQDFDKINQIHSISPTANGYAINEKSFNRWVVFYDKLYAQKAKK